jgi:hypothetical protein
VIRLMRAMVDLYCASYPKPPAAVTLDIDDTVDVVHGRQQLSLFNAHHDERCFLPIHVYDTATSRPVRCCCGRARPPRARRSGAICAAWCGRSGATGPHPHHPARRRPLRPPGGDGLLRGEGIDYVFGLPTNAVLRAAVEDAADDVRVRRAEADAPVLRRYAETRYGAKSWSSERRVVARIEASTHGPRHPLRGHQLRPRQRRVGL